MFLGHYTFGFLLKKGFKDIPLWLLFIAVQLVDILAFILIIFGIERIRYSPTTNAFLRTSLEYVPFTHSLTSGLIIAAIVYILFRFIKNKTWAIVLAVAVLSHWFIDIIVHPKEMPIIWNNFKTGFGLWQYPWIAFLIEVGSFVGAGYYLFRNTYNRLRPTILIVLAILLYTPIMFAPEGKVSVIIVSAISLSMYAIFTALAYWVDRKN